MTAIMNLPILLTRRLAPLILAFGALLASLPAAADFVVEDIRVEGAQNIEVGTIFNYLPIKVGDAADGALIDESIKALFATALVWVMADKLPEFDEQGPTQYNGMLCILASIGLGENSPHMLNREHGVGWQIDDGIGCHREHRFTGALHIQLHKPAKILAALEGGFLGDVEAVLIATVGFPAFEM